MYLPDWVISPPQHHLLPHSDCPLRAYTPLPILSTLHPYIPGSPCIPTRPALLRGLLIQSYTRSFLHPGPMQAVQPWPDCWPGCSPTSSLVHLQVVPTLSLRRVAWPRPRPPAQGATSPCTLSSPSQLLEVILVSSFPPQSPARWCAAEALQDLSDSTERTPASNHAKGGDTGPAAPEDGRLVLSHG